MLVSYHTLALNRTPNVVLASHQSHLNEPSLIGTQNLSNQINIMYVSSEICHMILLDSNKLGLIELIQLNLSEVASGDSATI